LADGQCVEILDGEVQGVRLYRKQQTGNLRATQVSLATASQPMALGTAPMYQRTFGVTGLVPVFPALPSATDGHGEKRKADDEPGESHDPAAS
jgi:hypothetical protein